MEGFFISTKKTKETHLKLFSIHLQNLFKK